RGRCRGRPPGRSRARGRYRGGGGAWRGVLWVVYALSRSMGGCWLLAYDRASRNRVLARNTRSVSRESIRFPTSAFVAPGVGKPPRPRRKFIWRSDAGARLRRWDLTDR